MNSQCVNATRQLGSLAEAKSELTGILGTMLRFPADFDAVPPPEELKSTCKLLSLTEHNIIVCGEARQGKSQFVNALLGQSVLPVDVVVTTSQVFRVGSAEKESYFLVFEDGLRKEIFRDDLARYGKQSDESLAQEPIFVGRKLKWIEVNVPAPNLPEGLHILDTPGLGALYARHAEITLRHIENADAVIFVTDHGAPLKESELSMLETIFAVTPNVLFVMSKKDLLNENQVEDLCARNLDILDKRFGKDIKRKFRFWPVSSEIYLSAAEDQGLRCESGFPSMLGALANLFERTTGLTCSQLAYSAAQSYWGRAAKFQKERLSALNLQRAERGMLLSEKRKRLAEYEKKWGERGADRIQYEGKIENVIYRCRNLFTNMFEPIRQMVSQKIDKLSLGDVEDFNKDMSNSIAADIQREVKRISEDAGKALAAITTEVISSIEVSIGDSNDLVDVSGGRLGGQIAAFAGGAISAAFKMSLVLSAVGLAAGVSVTAAEVLAVAATLTGPVGWAIAGILCVAGIGAVKKVKQQQLSQARAALKNNLQVIMTEAKTTLLVGRDMEAPPLEKWMSDTKAKALAVVKELAAKERNRLTAEIQRLEVDANADEVQLKSKLDKMGETLVSLRSRLIHVYEFLTRYDADERYAI